MDSETKNLNPDEPKHVRMRKKVITEILNTEETYQNHLQLLAKNFEEPLRWSAIVPNSVVVTIFSNIQQILKVNEELSEHLETCSVGEAFLKIAPFLKLYSTYANNHERALATLMEWDQKSSEFAAWRRLQEDSPEMVGLKLNALLITPVQRIPRYKLLLEELLQYTEEDHPDRGRIEEAVKQVSEVALHINEHIKQQDNSMRMIAIQRSLSGPGCPKILAPGRLFLKDGRLKKVAKKGGRSHERMFFLFSDILLYAKPKLLDNAIHQGAYTCCCILPLHHCSVSRVFGHSQGAGSLFSIHCKNESLLLYSDQKTVDSWIEALEAAIGAFQENRKTLKKPSSAKLPLRKSALVRLRKREKNADPLENMGKRSPENVSPTKIKRTRHEKLGSNFSCITPRRPAKTSTEERYSKDEIVDGTYRASDLIADEQPASCSEDVLACLSPRSKMSRSYQNQESGHVILRRGQELISCLSPKTMNKQNRCLSLPVNRDLPSSSQGDVSPEDDFECDQQYQDSYISQWRPMSAICEVSELQENSPGSRKSNKGSPSVLNNLSNFRHSNQGNLSSKSSSPVLGNDHKAIRKSLRSSKNLDSDSCYGSYYGDAGNRNSRNMETDGCYGNQTNRNSWMFSNDEELPSNERFDEDSLDGKTLSLTSDQSLGSGTEHDLSDDGASNDEGSTGLRSPFGLSLSRPPLSQYRECPGVTGQADLGLEDTGASGFSSQANPGTNKSTNHQMSSRDNYHNALNHSAAITTSYWQYLNEILSTNNHAVNDVQLNDSLDSPYSCGDGDDCEACLLAFKAEQDSFLADEYIITPPATPPSITNKTPVKRSTQNALNSVMNSMTTNASNGIGMISPPHSINASGQSNCVIQ